VAAAVIRRDGRVLLTRRRAGSHLAGSWEFPGGKREADETFPAALARELAEELRVTVCVGEPIGRQRYEYDDRIVELRFFDCRLVCGRIAPLGCDAVAWVPPGALADYPMPPADAAFVAGLMGGAGGRGAAAPSDPPRRGESA